MESLPDSILLSIFSNLRYEDLCLGVRMTCDRWRHLSFDPELWRCVELPSHFTDRRLRLLLEQVHAFIEELDLSQCDDVGEIGLSYLSKLTMPRLKKLCVPISGRFTYSMFTNLAEACPKLEELENLSPNVHDTCNPVLCQMLFPDVQVLHDRPVSTYGRLRPRLDVDTYKREQWQRYMQRASSALKDIKAYRCCRGMEYMDNNGMAFISKCLPQLRKLELRHCSVEDMGLQDFFLQNTSGGLTELIMDKPGPITDLGLQTIADNCPDLQNLKVSRCAHITSLGVQYLAARCQKLTQLHLNNSPSFIDTPVPKSDLDNKCLEVLGQHCPNLNCVRLFYSSVLSYRGLSSIVTGCHFLRALMLYECPVIDDQCLQLLLSCQFLRAMVLVNSNAITPKGLVDFVLVAPRLSRLSFYTKQTMFLDDVNELAESTYEKICADDADYRPNVMKFLTVRGVGGSFLQLLTVLCPKLRCVDLRQGCQVNTKSVVNVIKNCEMLEELDISSCDLEVEAQLLKAVCNYGHTLRKLSIGGPALGTSEEALYEVLTTCSSLRMFSINIQSWTTLDDAKLTAVAMESHGGYCCAKLDKMFDEETNYFLDLHFTPIKFLGSISVKLNNTEEGILTVESVEE